MAKPFLTQEINYRLLLSTRRYLFIAGGMFVLSWMLFFVLVFPRIRSVQEHRMELQDAQERLRISSEKLTLLRNVDQTELFQQQDKIQALLPNSKPLLSLIGQLEKLSADTSVIVSTFDVSPGDISTDSAREKKQSAKAQLVDNANVSQLPLSLVINGTIDDIYRFLEGIDTLMPLADVTSISLTPLLDGQTEANPNPPEGTVYEAEMTFQAYYFIGKAPTYRPGTLPNAQLRPDLLQKLQAFTIPDPQSLPPIPSSINGGKVDVFEGAPTQN